MLLSAFLPLVLAASSVSATAASDAGLAKPNARVASEVVRLERDLDPASLEALRSAQTKWENWLTAFDQRVAEILSDQPDADAKIAKIRAEVREMRVAFLETIPAKPVDRFDGGWGDGVTEILLQLSPTDRAKLVSLGRGDDGERIICLIEGAVNTTADGLELTPDQKPDYRVTLRRQGIALSIDGAAKVEGEARSLCPDGTFIAGKYFRIEGAEEVIPWLLN